MCATTDGHPPNSAKRPRPVISCLECRRKKLKCDRTHPCQQCLKIGRPGRCQYQPGSEPEVEATESPNTAAKRPRTHSPSSQLAHRVSSGLNGFGVGAIPQAKAGVIEDLQERVLRLEKALLTRNIQEESLSTATALSKDHERDLSAATAQKLVANGAVDPLVRSYKANCPRKKATLTEIVSGCLRIYASFTKSQP